MAGPLYYFPGFKSSLIEPARVLEVAKSLGLHTVLGDAISAGKADYQTICECGPDGVGGLILSIEPNKANYLPNDQNWTDCGKYWIGVGIGESVTPTDLLRFEAPLQNYTVKLLDGNEWSIMVVRPLSVETERLFALRPKRTENGREWLPEWECVSEHPWKSLVAELRLCFEGKSYNMDSWYSLALGVLGINYRIHADLADIMGILDSKLCMTVIGMAMDSPALERENKKKVLDESGTNAGNGTIPLSQAS